MDVRVNRSEAGVRAEHCMVATGHPLAARTAITVLDAGGSAVDAAIAADAVLGVVEPMATGIGGDLLAMIVEADGRAITYNGTGRGGAPPPAPGGGRARRPPRRGRRAAGGPARRAGLPPTPPPAGPPPPSPSICSSACPAGAFRNGTPCR